MYFSVSISSVNGARKDTRFVDGNMGRVVVKDFFLFKRGTGPFVRIDLWLNGKRYGGRGNDVDEVDETEEADDKADTADVSDVDEVEDMMLSVEDVRRGVGACERCVVLRSGSMKSCGFGVCESTEVGVAT